jgi:hypothetical protein
MKNLILTFIGVAYALVTLSQNYLPLDTVIEKTTRKEFEAIKSINIVDSLTLELYKPKYRQPYDSVLFINEKVLHLISEEVFNIFPIKNNLFFQVRSKTPQTRKYLVYNINNERLNEIIFSAEFEFCQLVNFFPDVSYRALFSKTRRNNLNLNLVDIDNNAEVFFADFSEFVETYDYLEDVVLCDGDLVDALFIDDGTSIVKLGAPQSTELCFESYKYFIVNNGKKNDISRRVVPDSIIKNYQLPNSTMQMVSADGRLIRESLAFRSRNWNTILGINRLIDLDYNTISDLLIIGHNASHNEGVYVSSDMLINGINMQNGRIVHYFVNSYLDYETRRQAIEVIIPYEFVPTLEIAMYNTYNNKLLTAKDIDGLTKLQLGILRNLVFAKHNYKFERQFYQAYFNLFAFYNSVDMMKTRTKNINHLLTEADKANLALIRAAEARVKE